MHYVFVHDYAVCLKVVFFDLGIRKEQKTLENKTFQGLCVEPRGQKVN